MQQQHQTFKHISLLNNNAYNKTMNVQSVLLCTRPIVLQLCKHKSTITYNTLYSNTALCNKAYSTLQHNNLQHVFSKYNARIVNRYNQQQQHSYHGYTRNTNTSNNTRSTRNRLLYTITGISVTSLAVYIINTQQNKQMTEYLYNTLIHSNDNNSLLQSVHKTLFSSYEILGYNLPVVVWSILAINVGVFGLWQVSTLEHFMLQNFTVSAYGVIIQKKLHTLVSSAFSHHGIGHLLFNCIAFASISQLLLYPTIYYYGLPALSDNQFLSIYLSASVASTLFSWLITALTTNRISRGLALSQRGLGASGAVYTLFTISAILFPQSSYYLMFIPYPITAETLLPGLVAFDVLGIILTRLKLINSPLGHGTHLGGVIFGLLVTYLYIKPKIEKQVQEMKKRSNYLNRTYFL